MNSQYALIAGQWPELHEEALKPPVIVSESR